MIWWIQVQTNNVPDLVNELRIGGQLEMFGAVRLYAEQSEAVARLCFSKGRSLRRRSARSSASRRRGLLSRTVRRSPATRLSVVGFLGFGPRLAVQADKALIETISCASGTRSGSRPPVVGLR